MAIKGGDGGGGQFQKASMMLWEFTALKIQGGVTKDSVGFP